MNETLMRKADIAGDYRSAAAFAKNMIAINDRIEVIEKEIEDFKGHTLIVSADPSIIGVDKADAKEISKLLSDLKDKYGFDGIEDAEIVEDEQ